jgi:hypothetical protein
MHALKRVLRKIEKKNTVTIAVTEGPINAIFDPMRKHVARLKKRCLECSRFACP